MDLDTVREAADALGVAGVAGAIAWAELRLLPLARAGLAAVLANSRKLGVTPADREAELAALRKKGQPA